MTTHGMRLSIEHFDFPVPRLTAQPEALAEMPSMLDHKFAESLSKEIRVLISHTQLGADKLADLHLHLSSLQHFTDEMREHNLGNKYGMLNGKGYAIWYLLETFFLSQMIGNSQRLGSVLQKSVRLVLPAACTDTLNPDFMSGRMVPSSATISKLRGTVDATWMLVWRDRLKEWLRHGVTIFSGTDSSPQGGRDYQILMLDITQKPAMPDLHVHINQLFLRFFFCLILYN